jgi:hypothetical protein
VDEEGKAWEEGREAEGTFLMSWSACGSAGRIASKFSVTAFFIY